MLERFWIDIAAWWLSVTPEFAFLLALPFMVAAAGCTAHLLRRRVAASSGDGRSGAAGP